MNRIGITAIKYIDTKYMAECEINYKDSRSMDMLSKYSFILADELAGDLKWDNIDPQRVACVLCSQTGSFNEVREFHEILDQKGAVGLNPGRFPNVMLSTPLSRITIALQIKGPSVPLFVGRDDLYQGVRYGIVQMKTGRCDGVMLLYANEDDASFGLFLEYEKKCIGRGLQPRFILHEEGNTIRLNPYKDRKVE